MEACSGNVCQGYVIASGGRNGQIEVDLSGDLSSQTGPTTNYDDDIVYSNGSFIVWPQAIPAD